MALSDIPGLVQHFRWSDEDAAFYDNEVFLDQSPYAAFGHNMIKIGGTPVFQNVGPNNRRGLYLDNTCHWQFPCQVPWHGSMLLIAQFNYVTGGTLSFHPMIFAEAVTVSSNGRLTATHASGQRRLQLIGPASALPSGHNTGGTPDGSIGIFMWSRNQEDRVGRFTPDGETVTTTSALAGTTNGNGIGFQGQPRVRVGNLNGTDGNFDDVSASLGSCVLLEAGWYIGDPLRDNLAEVGSAFAEAADDYGVVL